MMPPFALGWLGGNLLAHLLFPAALLWILIALLLGLLGWRSRFLVGVMLGFCWTLLWLDGHFHPLLEGGQVHDLEGEIVAPVRGTPYGWSVVFAGEERFRLFWPKKYPKPQAGQRWAIKALLFPPHGPFNPGGFDRELYDWRNDISGWGRVVEAPKRLGSKTTLASLRENIANTLEERLRGSPTSGLTQALLLGIRSGISQEQREILQATGTAHLLAISGLHIGLISGLVYGVLRRWPPVALVAAWGAAFGYAALAGFSLPTQRALVMVSIVLLALWSQRWFSPWHGLSLALVAVLLFDPRATLSLSFWLSFGAVFWLLYAVSNRSGQPPRWKVALKIQLFLFVGLLPLLLVTFGSISLTAPLANLIAIPFVGIFVIPLLFSGLLLLPVPLGEVPLRLAAWSLEKLLQFLKFLATAVGFPFPTPPLWAVVSASAGTLILLMPRGLPGRWLGFIFWLPFFTAGGWPPLDRGEMRLTLLDVGHGLAAVIETKNHLLLYDTGPPGTGRRIILPFLRFLGKEPDLIVVSHEDRDHSGGLKVLRRHFPTAPVLSGTPEKLKTPPCFRGQRWWWDGISFEVLWPPEILEDDLSDNDRSCVLKITTSSQSVLLTGDIDKKIERRLLGEALESEILVAPHHGSNSSSSWRFLEAVRPRYGLFSSGYGRRFPSPHREVLERYRKVGAEIHITAQAGAILVELDPSGIQIRHWRRLAGHYWNFGKTAIPPGRSNH